MTDEKLLAAILETATPDTPRGEFMRALAESFDAELCLLTQVAPNGEATPRVESSRDDAVLVGEWIERTRRAGALWPAGASSAPWTVISTDLHDPVSSPPALRDWAARHGLRSALHALAPGDPPTSLYVSMFSDRSDAFGEDRRERLRGLLPPLAHATRMRAMLALERARGRASKEVLDTLPVGVVVSDCERRVLHCNRLAQQLLDARDGLRIDDGRLVHAFPVGGEAARAFEGQIGAALEGGEPDLADATPGLELPRRDGSPVVMISVPLRTRDEAGDGRPGEPAIVTYLSAPEHFVELAPIRLQRSFDLTAAEADVAIALATGKSLREAATESGRAEATLRKHLQNVFQKTGTHRQSELVSLLLRRMI